MPRISDFYKTAKEVHDAPLVQLSGVVLQVLASSIRSSRDCECANNFLLSVAEQYSQHEGAMLACAEAWAWLEANGFLCPQPGGREPWMTLTRLARKAAEASNFQSWTAERQLPEDMLHPMLRGITLQLFRQGLFDTAVFEAFKALEVAIRDAARLGDEFVGTKLVVRAFHPESGELSDLEAEAGERQALMNLMSGAIGSYKNPQSHRHVGLDAAEAREMLLLASHLVKIVESRALRAA